MVILWVGQGRGIEESVSGSAEWGGLWWYRWLQRILNDVVNWECRESIISDKAHTSTDSLLLKGKGPEILKRGQQENQTPSSTQTARGGKTRKQLKNLIAPSIGCSDPARLRMPPEDFE